MEKTWQHVIVDKPPSVIPLGLLTAPLVIQIHANGVEGTEDGSSSWAPTTHMGILD